MPISSFSLTSVCALALISSLTGPIAAQANPSTYPGSPELSRQSPDRVVQIFSSLESADPVKAASDTIAPTGASPALVLRYPDPYANSPEIACINGSTVSFDAWSPSHGGKADKPFSGGEHTCTPGRSARPDAKPLEVRIPDCHFSSSETGFFTFIHSNVSEADHDGAGPDVQTRSDQDSSENLPDPLVVLCETTASARSMFVYTFRHGQPTLSFSLTDKARIQVGLTEPGLIVGWLDSGQSMENYQTTFWEVERSTWGSQAYLDARDAAIGQRIERFGELPDGLGDGGGDGHRTHPARSGVGSDVDHQAGSSPYFMATRPDTPLRLAPDWQAPWFIRLDDHLLIHLGAVVSESNSESRLASSSKSTPSEGPDPDQHRFWVPDEIWRRVCIVDGGCGYVPADRLTQLKPA